MHLTWKAALISAATATSLLAEAKVISFRPASVNNLELRVDKTGLLSGKQHRFVFTDYDGTLEFDEASPSRSKVVFTVRSDSIECLDTWVSPSDLKKVLKAAKTDMLSVERYPTISFRSTDVEAKGPDSFEVSGMLTIRDKTRLVVLKVNSAGPGRPYAGETRIRLTDFGLKPPGAALGLVGTKDEMLFSFKLAS